MAYTAVKLRALPVAVRALAGVATGALTLTALVATADSAQAATTVLSTARATVISAVPAPYPAAGSAEYDPTNISSVGGQLSTSTITVSMGGGTLNRSFYLDLDPDFGTTFHTGTQVSEGSGATELAVGSESCENVRYDILDLAASGSTITRLDVVFQTNCTGDNDDYSTIYGELTVGEPTPSSTLLTGARTIRWPDTPVGTRAPGLLPVWVRNTAATAQPIGRAALTGADPSDFTLISNSCPSALAGHASCLVTVGFTPRTAGNLSATLTIPVGGTAATTDLEGTGPAGRTLLRINSQPGDYVGAGGSYLITDAQSPITLENHDSSWFTAATTDADQWMVSIRNQSGAALSVGTHTVTTSGSGYSLDVTGDGRGCSDETGSVTISQVSYAGPDPVAFDASFTQRCTNTPNAALTGEIAYRATNTPATSSGPFIVRSGAPIHAGHSITSSTGESVYRLAVTGTGRAVLSLGASTLWSSPAADASSTDRLAVLGNGMLALINPDGSVLWNTPAAGSNAFAALQDDGNLVLYNSQYVPIWATNTAHPS